MTPEQIRNAALEEAARIADDHTPDRPLASRSTAMVIAAAIRALKEQEPRPAEWGEGEKGDE